MENITITLPEWIVWFLLAVVSIEAVMNIYRLYLVWKNTKLKKAILSLAAGKAPEE